MIDAVPIRGEVGTTSARITSNTFSQWRGALFIREKVDSSSRRAALHIEQLRNKLITPILDRASGCGNCCFRAFCSFDCCRRRSQCRYNEVLFNVRQFWNVLWNASNETTQEETRPEQHFSPARVFVSTFRMTPMLFLPHAGLVCRVDSPAWS